MNSTLFLGCKYQSLIISFKDVCSELNINVGTGNNMLTAGTFPVPVRKEGNKRVVDIRDLGEYLDARREEAKALFDQKPS